MTDEPVAVSDPADELMSMADLQGIPAAEINEEAESVFELIFSRRWSIKKDAWRSSQSVLG
jgi:hypothetical protein